MDRLKSFLKGALSANGAALVAVYAAALFVAVTFSPTQRGEIGRSAQQAPMQQLSFHKG